MSLWTQPLCDNCYTAFELGAGNKPRVPARVIVEGVYPEGGGDPCVVCATPTTIYVRIDPALTMKLRERPRA